MYALNLSSAQVSAKVFRRISYENGSAYAATSLNLLRDERANASKWCICAIIAHMAKLFPAESTNSDPTVGGFVVVFPSGIAKSVAWRSEAPIQDTLAASKQYAAKLVQTMIEEQRIDDLERTNIPSLVAAIQRLINDWNEKRRAALHAASIQ